MQTQGAAIEGGAVKHFGAPAEELRTARDGLVVADLSHYGLIGFEGEDTQTFLHGQLTNDMRGLKPEAALFAGYCTAKGRLLANFLVFRRDAGVLLMLPEAVREAVQKKLSMFILRSKVKARDAGPEWVRLGLNGIGAREALVAAIGAAPQGMMSVLHTDSAFAVQLGDNRFDLFVQPDHAQRVWQALTTEARPVGAPAWDWLMIRAGVAMVLAPTQDQFVPQMLNMEVLHGISFQKGCYPGQEIVARTQYLGKIKRRTYLAHVEAAVRPGDELFSPDLPGQACGVIANAAPAPEGGSDVLAVMQVSSFEAGEVRWQRPDGPQLRFEPLPYSL
ncbi:YgfZ/GcvT domain-containing protein [Sulfuritortus calidifontis]|uniref:CAF17-like 4Fe-4S cluster assembly/insertion protein YgfZ n=1 Tax=Sulfuritortus calidifontis TaxID=1914471 RepID=UPI001E2A5C59|nr:folate-binding protein [Sulfuritortus calidifontis]